MKLKNKKTGKVIELVKKPKIKIKLEKKGSVPAGKKSRYA